MTISSERMLRTCIICYDTYDMILNPLVLRTKEVCEVMNSLRTGI